MILNNELKEKILASTVISFDIFDTLIKRYTKKPSDVFDIVEEQFKLCYDDYSSDNFKNKRILAERKARKKTDKEEICLRDIYSEIEMENSYKEKFIELEILTEIAVCHINSSVYDIYRFCKQNNKKIIITSDMYLSLDVIKNILYNSGITDYDGIFLSSDILKKKSTGNLFKYILDNLDIEPNELLHIGDNQKSDIIMPMSLGINVWHIDNDDNSNNDLFERSIKKSKLVDGFISNYKQSDYCKKLGYCVLGPLLYGFITWLEENIQKEKPDKILFLSRDGEVMSRAFSALYPNQKFSYVYASRRALIVPILWKNCELEHIKNIIKFHDRMSICTFLERVGLSTSDCKEELFDSGYLETDTVNLKDFTENPKFIYFYSKIKNKIIENSKNEYTSAVKYWQNQIKGASKVFIVDIGWNGNMQNALINMINDDKCKIMGYYLGVNPETKFTFPMSGYIYDKTFNKEYKKIIENFTSILETFFMTDQGSLLRYVDKEPYIELYENEYRIEENKIVNEIDSILKIQDSAIDFVREMNMYISKLRLKYSLNDGISNIMNFALSPSLKSVEFIGDFRFFNSGISYIAHPKNGKFSLKELMNTNWRIGYMKRCFKLNLHYDKIAILIKLSKKIINK